MFKKLLLLLVSLFSITYVGAIPINIVSAENFYAELAREIGGNKVKVQSIISNPDADPHLFATSPSTNRALSQAQIIIYNGADYDPWMEQILKNINQKKVIVINVATLIAHKPATIPLGEMNPHIWYKSETFPLLAKTLAANIIQLNPAAKLQTQTNLKTFLAGNQQVAGLIAQIKAKYAGTAVTATEPVFGYMSEAMGLKMYGIDYQWKIMNGTEPSPKMIAHYQSLLSDKQVKVLFYNSQVSDPMSKNMQALAKKNGIAIIGVTETMPNAMTINAWLSKEVMATAAALALNK